MQTYARPGGCALMAAVAGEPSQGAHALIGRVRVGPPISRRIGASVAIGALGSDDHLAVIKL